MFALSVAVLAANIMTVCFCLSIAKIHRENDVDLLSGLGMVVPLLLISIGFFLFG